MSPTTHTLPRLASLGSERTLRPLLRVAGASLRSPCAPASRWARWARCGLAVGLPLPPAVIIPRSAGIFVRPLRFVSSCCVSYWRGWWSPDVPPLRFAPPPPSPPRSRGERISAPLCGHFAIFFVVVVVVLVLWGSWVCGGAVGLLTKPASTPALPL